MFLFRNFKRICEKPFLLLFFFLQKDLETLTVSDEKGIGLELDFLARHMESAKVRVCVCVCSCQYEKQEMEKKYCRLST
jgi:hypothetical protein